MKVCAISRGFQPSGRITGRLIQFASDEILFTLAAYFALNSFAALPGGCLDQIRQGEQIRRAEQRTPGRLRHERVGSFDVGPSRRQRVDTLVSRHPEEHSVLTPGVSEPDQVVLLASQGVERVGDTESLPVAAGLSS